MPVIDCDGLPLVVLGPVTDVWVAGTHHVEILGSAFRTIYFKWVQIEGRWRKIAAEFATVREIGTCFANNPRAWNVPIIELSGARLRPESVNGLTH